MQVKITKKDKPRTATGWPRPFNRWPPNTGNKSSVFMSEISGLDRLMQGRYIQVPL